MVAVVEVVDDSVMDMYTQVAKLSELLLGLW